MVRVGVFILFLAVAVDAAPSGPGAIVIWAGAEVTGLTASVDISAVQQAYESRGYRTLRADAVEPEVLKALVQQDRASHPKDYEGKVVTLLVHGKGVARRSEPLPTTVLGFEDGVTFVRDEALIGAFVEGIGPRARAEIISSTCFTKSSCREVDVAKTPFLGRVTRLLVSPEYGGQGQARLSREERVLSGLLDLVIQQTPWGVAQKKRQPSAGPLGDLERMARKHGRDGRSYPQGRAVEVPLLVPDRYLISLADVGIVPSTGESESTEALLRKLRLRLDSEEKPALPPAGE